MAWNGKAADYGCVMLRAGYSAGVAVQCERKPWKAHASESRSDEMSLGVVHNSSVQNLCPVLVEDRIQAISYFNSMTILFYLQRRSQRKRPPSVTQAAADNWRSLRSF
jgi:hypothetical protein